MRVHIQWIGSADFFAYQVHGCRLIESAACCKYNSDALEEATSLLETLQDHHPRERKE